MKYCQRCVYPAIAAHLEIQGGICSACRTAEQMSNITDEDWVRRQAQFGDLVSSIRAKSSNTYDCLIPVSGGKDSYYQTHIMTKKYGLKPLLVTYHGNNFLPVGDENRDRMRQVFDADHLVFGPSVRTLKKLNRVGFKLMGDMNWHAHCGIFTYPVQIAKQLKIPLVIWGEAFWDISGMFNPNDFVEFSARNRHEHELRGYEWSDLVGLEELEERDLLWAKYPSDEEILEVGIRGIAIGNYFKWDPNKNTNLIRDLYGWKASEQEFQRTYRKMSNLDDRYENGAHDFLKFIKFGYGRGSDHSSKDIRLGYMSRDEGIDMVRKYDHVVPDDLSYWLKYVEMDETEFWKIADTFRHPDVWWIEKGKWWKETIWGTSEPYGEVYLSSEEQEKFKRK